MSAAVILDCAHPREVILSSSMQIARLRLAEKSFSVAGPRAWNSLPSHIRTLASRDSFSRHALKDPFSSSPMTFSDLFCVAVLTVYVLVHIFNVNKLCG